MKNAHIIAIPFSGVGLHGGFRGDEWYKHRIEVFKNYTLKSLANQSNKDFLIWLWFRPEEEHNPLTQEIFKAIREANLNFIATFHGLMYWDDKFTNYTFKIKIRNFLMMLWDCWIYKEWKKRLWKYTWENKNKTLFERLTKALKILSNSLEICLNANNEENPNSAVNSRRCQCRDSGECLKNNYNGWIYLTRLDSDDMLHREAVNLIQSESPMYKKALVFKEGYIYNVKTNQVAEWNPPTNPPFHTIIFPGHTFFNAQLHKEYYSNFGSHEDIPRIFQCTELDMHKYMVSFHGKHISTGWDSPLPRRIVHKYKGYCYTTSGKNISTHWQSRTRHVKNYMIGREFFGEEKKLILNDFGL